MAVFCVTGNSTSSANGPWPGASFIWIRNHAKGRWWPFPGLKSESASGGFSPAGGGPEWSSSGTSAMASCASRTAHLLSSNAGLAAAWSAVIPTRQPLFKTIGDPRLLASSAISGVEGASARVGGACRRPESSPSSGDSARCGGAGCPSPGSAKQTATTARLRMLRRKNPPSLGLLSTLIQTNARSKKIAAVSAHTLQFLLEPVQDGKLIRALIYSFPLVAKEEDTSV